jgi:hypothetical protein
MDVASIVVLVTAAAKPAPAASRHDDVALYPWVTAVVNTAPVVAAPADTAREGELS